MAKVLISLVGGRPFPNILVALHLKPDYNYLVTSQDSLGTGGDYEKTITALPETLRPSEPLPVRPYNLQDTIARCRKITSQHTNDEIVINVTLGPKTMAFGAYDIAKELRADQQQVDVCYLAREGLVWVFRNEIEAVKIGLKEYFASYGWHINFKTVSSDRLLRLAFLLVEQLPISNHLLQVLRSCDKGKGKRTIHCNRHLLDDTYALLKKIASMGLMSNVSRDQKSTSWTINSDEDGRLVLSGDWLEFYTYQIAKSVNKNGEPLFDECGWGVEDTSGKGEIDFAGAFGGQVILASCKTENSIKRTWFEELHSKAEQLGKGMCSTLLISTVSRSTRSDKDLRDYKKWARERQIILVMAEDLPRLSAILKKIVSADRNAEPKDVPYYARI